MHVTSTCFPVNNNLFDNDCLSWMPVCKRDGEEGAQNIVCKGTPISSGNYYTI